MYSIIFVTCLDKKQGQKIARKLIEEKLAACVNIVDKVESIFRWQGKIDCAKETLLIIKSRKKELKKIIRVVKSLHSYSVPEIIALDIAAGEKKYLKWIDESVG